MLGFQILGAAMQNLFLVFTIIYLRDAEEEQPALGKVSIEQSRVTIDHAVGITALGGGLRSRFVDATGVLQSYRQVMIQSMEK